MIYLAISYVCNQKCTFCPCGTLKQQREFLPLSEIYDFIEKNADIEDRHIIISGGEPTLHPNFTEIIKLFQKEHYRITILTTSERFSDLNFTKQVFENLDPSGIKVITTLHSQSKEEHEHTNGTSGSFERSIAGVKNVAAYGCIAVVKHCITRANYKDLNKFYHFVNQVFPQQINIQFCSIDYCGIDDQNQEQEFVSFPMMKEYLEDMFDAYMSDLRDKRTMRRLYCINMPLCAAEPIYWQFLQKNSAHYAAHISPNSSGNLQVNYNVKDIVSISEMYCQNCLVKNICAGTYCSAFDIYGERLIVPYQ